MNIRLCIVLLILRAAPLQAQTMLSGSCIDAEGGFPIRGVSVRSGNAQTKSDVQGKFRLESFGDTLYFSHIAYQVQWCIPNKQTEHCRLIKLERKSAELKPFTVQGKRAPDTVVSSEKWMIRDFCFYGDSLLLLTWDKKPSQCSLRLSDDAGTILLSSALPDEPLGFHIDPFGNHYLECKNQIFRIHIYSQSIRLEKMDEQKYWGTIRPVCGYRDSMLYGSTWRYHRPEFAYLKYDLQRALSDTLCMITDKHLSDLYHAEYVFLSFPTKCEINRRSRQTGEDRYELAAWHTGFTQSLWWHPLYAPLFMKDSSIFVFDHYENQILRFSGNDVSHTPFSFHARNEYKNKIVQDDFSGDLYALYYKNGRYSLEQIDLNKGSTSLAKQVSYRYAQGFRIKKGRVYYLWRPFESDQHTFLYAEDL